MVNTNTAAALGNPLGGIDFPIRSGFRQQHRVLASGQAGQCLFAPVQGRFLIGGQVLPIDVESSPERGGVADTLNGLTDPVIARGQRAIIQLPVQLLRHVFHLVVPILGKPDPELFENCAVPGSAGNRLPCAAVPFLQNAVLHSDGFRGSREPFLHHIDHLTAGGRGNVHNHIHAPVGIRLHLRQHRRCKLGGVLLADLPQRHVGVHRHLHHGFGTGHQTHAHKHKGNHCQQADPEAGLAVIQNRLDPVFHTDLSEGHRAGRIMDLIRTAPQKRG